MHKNLAILTLTVIAALLLCGAVSAESVENNVGNIQNPEISTEINEIPTQLNEEVTNPSNQEQTENPPTVNTVNQNEQISSSPNLQDNSQETSKDSVDTVTIQESSEGNSIATQDISTDIQETQQENTVETGTEQNTNSQDTNSAYNESLANEYTTYHVYAGQSIQDAVNNAKPGDTIIIHEGVYNEPVNVYSPISIKLAEGENVILADPTWHVYPGQSIQTAINGALAGDTIIVHAGTYNESVSITKSNLTLQAAPGETVTIQPTTTTTIIKIIGTFSVPVQYVTVNGFNLIGTGSTGGIPAQGVGLLYAQFCTITNNILTNQKDAEIDVTYSYNNTISNNRINGLINGGPTLSGYGIRQIGSGSIGNVYQGNNVTNCVYGIGITDGGNTTVSNNSVIIPETNMGRGIILNPGTPANQVNIISNNSLTKAVKTTTDTTGILINGAQYSFQPSNNVVNNLIYSNDIINCLKGIDFVSPYSNNWNNTIYLNRIYNNTYGLKSSISTLSSINATNNWWGKNTTPTIYTGTSPTAPVDIWRTDSNGNLYYNPWLVLNATANPTSILTGETSNITADLTKNSNGQDTTTIYPGKFVPNGIPVTFEVLDALGTVNPINTNITNGTANTTFTAGSVPGNSTIVAKVDGMDGTTPEKTVNTTVEILQPAADIDVTKNFFYEDLGPIVFPDNPLDRYWKFFSEVVVTNNGPDTATNVRISDLT